jgi:hypothetical protein
VWIFFDRLFPQGFAGADVLAERAPQGWEQSSLAACFHPFVERLFEERLMMHRNLDELRRIRLAKHGTTDATRPDRNQHWRMCAASTRDSRCNRPRKSRS